MKKMRWLSLLLILVLAVTMIAGCAKAPKEEEGATTGEFVEVIDKDDDDQKPSDNNDPDDGDDEPSDRPGDDEPGNNEPGDDEPGNNEPGNNEPGDDEPGNNEPGDGDPSDEPGDDEIIVDQDAEYFDPASTPVAKETSGTKIRFLSQNIKHAGGQYGEVGDGTSISKINRMNRFTTMVKKYDPDIIMEQEARAATIDFFTKKSPYFSALYDICWTWRNPYGIAGGEQTEPILWKKDKYKVLDKGYMWTNEKQTEPGKSYDAEADYGDVNCWVKVQDKKTKDVFTAYCVHYAHTGKVAQIKSFQQYLSLVDKMKADEYLFAGGDYNVTYRTEKYETMMDWSKIVDLRDVALNLWEHDLCELGEMNGSFIGGAFDRNEPTVTNPGGGAQIDHLMAKYHPKMAVDYYGLDYDRYENIAEGAQKGWISDHYALIVDVRINTETDYSQYMKKHDYGTGPVYWRKSNEPAKSK